MRGVVDSVLNAISLNHDGTKIAVAGKHILKVLGCTEETFLQEFYNLKLSKASSAALSHLDVSWCPVEDNLIASAVTNGAVALWNLSLQSHKKLDRMLLVHQRTANKVTFHPTEANYLLSGSQDATVVFFDLRKAEPALHFDNGTDSVRDIKFASCSPQLLFSLGDETGSVKLWDARMPDKPLKSFTAHNGPIFSLDFHPSTAGILATAGRDKLIKVWNLHDERRSPSRIMQTIAPVSMVRWHPNNESLIASASLVMDFSVYVWDVRRPCLPFAYFEGHTNAVTGLLWQHESDRLISSGKDCELIMHDPSNAFKLENLIAPVAMDMNCHSEMITAVGNVLVDPSNDNESNMDEVVHGQQTLKNSKWHSKDNNFHTSHFSHVHMTTMPQSIQKDFGSKWMVDLAKLYKFRNGTVQELCEHNAKVALGLRRETDGYSWLLLKDIYMSGHLSLANIRRYQRRLKATRRCPSTAVLMKSCVGRTNESAQMADYQELPFFSDHSSSSFSDDCDDVDLSEPDIWDFPPTTSSDWTVKAEPMKIPRDAFDNVDQAVDVQIDLRDKLPFGKFVKNGFAKWFHQIVANRKMNMAVRLIMADTADFVRFLVEMLHYHVETLFNVQISVTMLLVLGEIGRGVVKEWVEGRWFHAYIELLRRNKLFSIATIMTKCCTIETVKARQSQLGATDEFCSRCGRSVPNNTNVCATCNVFVSICSLCQCPVEGAFVWCSTCQHGGHADHYKEWFEQNDDCPSLCSHRCNLIKNT